MGLVNDQELSAAVDRTQKNFRTYVAEELKKFAGWTAAASDYAPDSGILAAVGSLSVTIWVLCATLTFLAVAVTFWWRDWVSCHELSWSTRF